MEEEAVVGDTTFAPMSSLFNTIVDAPVSKFSANGIAFRLFDDCWWFHIEFLDAIYKYPILTFYGGIHSQSHNFIGPSLMNSLMVLVPNNVTHK